MVHVGCATIVQLTGEPSRTDHESWGAMVSVFSKRAQAHQREILILGANWIRPDHMKWKWRVVVGQLAT